MHLKSLTLRGFKSFASATTFELEPGITCIVGPNGSGKSNVVDALAWVMGEQGAKSLRGGSMEDVVFAGTSGRDGAAARPPLGRAEVTLTIDNTDGALPIEYAEVTISRTMFRTGGSDYAINGRSCRLLDVQELLSDSGIGREMHVIVGQGQLDAILRATPEERRGFVEEAAGVLKHRKRKEKALRKLESTEGNLVRLGDLLSELRRQLKPLGRQAEVARKAAVVQADVRDARARLLADELDAVRAHREELLRRVEELTEGAERDRRALARLSALLAEGGGADAGEREEALPPPATVLEAVQRAADRAEHLVFTPDAFESAADSPFRRPAEVLEALEALDALAGRFAAGEMGVSLVQAASETGLTYKQGVSEIARSRNPHHYTATWEGHRLDLGPHVALGSGSGAGFIARIYLHVADGTGEVPRGLYVGHVGRHLPDTTT